METYDHPRWTLGQLAEELGGALFGPPELEIVRPVAAGDDDPQGIAFAESEKFLRRAERSQVGALLLPPDLVSRVKPYLQVPSPRAAFFTLLQRFDRPLALDEGQHPTAVVHPSAQVDPSARLGAYVVIERGAVIGPEARVHPFCYVGEACEVAESATLYPGVVLYRGVCVGARTAVHAGAILGADGFGFEQVEGRRIRVPQIGRVEIGADAEIGANTAVDRATVGATRVGSGTKLDNLIQVGHNVEIGAHTVIASLTGLAGSAKIGDRVAIGGQCAVNAHTEVGDDIMIGGSSGVAQDLPDKGVYFGSPAMPMQQGLRVYKLVPKLPDLLVRLRALEKRLAELEKERA